MSDVRKLVRDKIPEYIMGLGKKVTISLAKDQEEYLQGLRDKINEEAYELATARKPEDIAAEAADLYEVVAAYLDECGIDGKTVSDARIQKHQDKGGFMRRIFLHGI